MAAHIEKLGSVRGWGERSERWGVWASEASGGGGCRRAKRAARRRPRLGAEGAVQASWY